MKIARSSLKWVENTVGKGEMARYEPFLLFPQCFQKACFPGASKGLIVWKWVKSLSNNPMLLLLFLRKASESTVGKREDTGDDNFLHFPVFLTMSLTLYLICQF